MLSVGYTHTHTHSKVGAAWHAHVRDRPTGSALIAPTHPPQYSGLGTSVVGGASPLLAPMPSSPAPAPAPAPASASGLASASAVAPARACDGCVVDTLKRDRSSCARASSCSNSPRSVVAKAAKSNASSSSSSSQQPNGRQQQQGQTADRQCKPRQLGAPAQGGLGVRPSHARTCKAGALARSPHANPAVKGPGGPVRIRFPRGKSVATARDGSRKDSERRQEKVGGASPASDTTHTHTHTHTRCVAQANTTTGVARTLPHALQSALDARDQESTPPWHQRDLPQVRAPGMVQAGPTVHSGWGELSGATACQRGKQRPHLS